jgi:hypothetical protein
VIPRGLGEIASDIELVSGSWTVVVCDQDRMRETVDELRDEVEFAFEDSDGTVVSVDAARGVESMLEELGQCKPDDVALVVNADSLDPAALEQLDGARTRLEGGPRVVMVMTEPALAALADHAPHLWSWMSSRVFSVDRAVGQLDVETRLESLRQGTGLTDAEIIQRASDGTLPVDPIYAEWLILLGRGELIGA